MLVDLAAKAKLFHNSAGTAFADLAIDGHRETWPVRSTRFRMWLRRGYYAATGEAPSAAAVTSALDQIEAVSAGETARWAAEIETDVLAARARSSGSRQPACPTCGAPARAGDRFCPACGAALDSIAELPA